MTNLNKKTYTFHANGMHCKSCSLIIEQDLKDLSYVDAVHANSHTQIVTVTGDFEGISPEDLAKDFSTLLSKKGYSFSVEKNEAKKDYSDFKIAVPISISFVLLFILLQKMGLINLVNTKNISYGTSFLIGVVASVSSCMAVVGGLVLSMSASFAKEAEANTYAPSNLGAKEGSKVKPQLLFHIGRLASFFVLGGVIGSLGAVFTLGSTGTFVISLIIGIVMIILGLNLLEFHFIKRFQPTMPKFLSKYAMKATKINHTLTPLLIGIVTFFLPCGFTQSMQIYTLSTGSFFAGALTMFAFALGTFPALALVSFSSLSVKDSKWSGVFFKTAGIIVVLFALFNIINGLVVIGAIQPVFSF